jgi:hypothetical protein
MSLCLVRLVLPVVVSGGALLLAVAGPAGLVPEAAAARLGTDAIARAEVGRCMAGGRDADDCLDEADGKALVERAAWLARDDAASRRASSQ